MSYKQNNPLSRKNSPLNKDDRWIQKATESIKERGTEGVCTGDKFGGPTCPPGSKRYNLAKTFKKMAKDRKGGPSRKSSEPRELKDMPIVDIEKGDAKGDYSGWSPGKFDPYGDTDPFVTQSGWSPGEFDPYGDTNPFDERSGKKMGPRRESSSPLNNTGITGLNYSKELKYMPIEDDMHRGMSRQPYGGNKGDEKRSKRDYEGVSRQPYGGNKGDEKKSVRDYEGPSRKSSSPLDYGSWAAEDSKRAKKLYKEGDYAHAHALGIDEHDADYAKHWHRDEAEHGVSRKSRSERLRSRAMKRSERTGAEWGDYDYEDPRVQKMLAKARKLDERSGK